MDRERDHPAALDLIGYLPQGEVVVVIYTREGSTCHLVMAWWPALWIFPERLSATETFAEQDS